MQWRQLDNMQTICSSLLRAQFDRPAFVIGVLCLLCINLLKRQDNGEYNRIICTAAIQSYVKSQRRVMKCRRIAARTLRLLVAKRVCRHLAITVKASHAERPVVAPLYMKRAVKVKVKFSHTRYRALGPELIPVYRQSARR